MALPRKDRMSDEDRKAFWSTLLQKLRATFPEDKIQIDKGAYLDGQTLLWNDVEVDVALDQEHRYVGYSSSRYGRAFFRIGAYRRGEARKRAVEGNAGFNWDRVVDLLRQERDRTARETTANAEDKAARVAAETQLKALFKRRPDLKSVGYHARIVHGQFEIDVHTSDISVVERALDLVQETENEP